MNTNLKIGGVFEGTIYRDGKVIDQFESKNIVVDTGLNLILNRMIGGVTSYPSSIMIGSNPYQAVATDVYPTINTQAGRLDSTTLVNTSPTIIWTPVNIGSAKVSNKAAPCVFVAKSAVTVYNTYLAYFGVSQFLVAYTLFDNPKILQPNDALAIVYSIQIQSVT